jgi:hypothetical protein
VERLLPEELRAFSRVFFTLMASLEGAKFGERIAAAALLAYEGRFLEGEAYPSVATLGQLAGLSERAMQGHLNRLLDRRRLLLELRRGRSSVYRMALPGKPSLAPLRKAGSSAHAGAESAPRAKAAADLRPWRPSRIAEVKPPPPAPLTRGEEVLKAAPCDPSEAQAALEQLAEAFGAERRAEAAGVLQRERPSAPALRLALAATLEYRGKAVQSLGGLFCSFLRKATAGELGAIAQRLEREERAAAQRQQRAQRLAERLEREEAERQARLAEARARGCPSDPDSALSFVIRRTAEDERDCALARQVSALPGLTPEERVRALDARLTAAERAAAAAAKEAAAFEALSDAEIAHYIARAEAQIAEALALGMHGSAEVTAKAMLRYVQERERRLARSCEASASLS